MGQVAGHCRSEKTGVLVNIQALRGVAALLVVFVHLETLAERAGINPALLTFGNSGVDLFFVISGLIMVVTTARADVTAGSFIAQRIARVVPLYWLITLVVFMLALLAPWLMQATQADASDLVYSLLFIPFQKGNGLTQPIVFVGWTLNYEMAFYVLFALSLLTRHRLLGFAITTSILLAAAIIGAIVRPTDTLGAFYTAPIVLEFALGMGLGIMIPRLPPSPWLKLAAYPVSLISFCLLIIGPSLWPDTDRLFVFGLPAAALVGSSLILERAGLVVSSPLIRRLGDASYSIYLTHFFITQAAVKGVVALGIEGVWPLTLVCGAMFVVIAITGLVVHATVERPMSQAVRRATNAFTDSHSRPGRSGAHPPLPRRAGWRPARRL